MKKSALFFTVFLLAAPSLCRAEKIYLSDGAVRNESIAYRDKNSLWIKHPDGVIGINLNRITKIENDDGSLSKYDYDNICKKIQQLVKEEKFSEAATTCDMLLETFPDSTKIHYMKALLNHRAGNTGETIGDYKFILDKDVEDPKVMNNLGAIYASDKNTKQATEMFDKAAKKNPGMPEPHENLAMLFMSLKDYNSAIEEYKKVIEKEPENTGALYNLGVAYINTKDYQEAREAMEKVLAVNKDDRGAKDALKYLEGKK